MEREIVTEHPLVDNQTAVFPAAPDALVTDRSYRIRELVPVATCIGLGIGVLVFAQDINSQVGVELGPAFWPSMLGYSLIVFGALLVFVNVLRGVRPADIPDRLNGWGVSRFCATAVLLVGYVLLWNVLQFWLITLVVSLALTALYGARGWKALLAFPALVSVILHVLFVLVLRVPL
ncbi:tripartite tricarboxylate transporter TctB family protein [Cryobacterium aureum]|uniref:tripartite tricarboxylate transporter TctB family protein n=1 Tax=Cryobacterium aureum TaxID=995037 RepID=UPI000CF4C42B|nr:tripartite tricarboxylate transporter TctB family protein [Cryobacterium aureum]